MSWAGRWWRVIGILLLAATWWVGWVASGAFNKAGWMVLGLVAFVVTWFNAAWFDVNEKCCSETRPHTRQDYGEGEHWVLEDVR